MCAVRGCSYISKPKINQVKLTCVPAVNHGVNLRLTSRNEFCERRRTYILEIRFVLNFRAILPEIINWVYLLQVQRLSKNPRKQIVKSFFTKKNICNLTDQLIAVVCTQYRFHVFFKSAVCLPFFQVIAFTCCAITVIFLLATMGATDWVQSNGWQEGLFKNYI